MLNKVQIIGRLGKNPETRSAQNGTPFATFTVATDHRWTSPDGQKQSRTEWHQAVAWGKLAEICGEFLKKGRLVYLEGRLQTRSWDDQDGHRRQATEIVIHDMKILEPKQPVIAPLPAPEPSDIPF